MSWPKSLSKKMESFRLRPKVHCRSSLGGILRSGRSIKTKVNLAKYTSFKIGGAAEFFLKAETVKELQNALSFAKNKRIPIFILGSGSNILVSDSGVKGLVIKLSGKYFKDLYNKGTCVVVGSGLKLTQLVLFAKTKGLSGLEFLAGIPGTLGGSLLGNAGAWGESIGTRVRQIRVLDYNGKLSLLKAKDLKFAYRESNLNKYIIISAELELFPGNKDTIASKMSEYLLERRKTQSNTLPNAGCIFKNPDKNSAGKLIDACGLKGKVNGGAVISNKHANFILNRKKASSKDVLFLMDLMRKEVKARFKINLEPEIKLWR